MDNKGIAWIKHPDAGFDWKTKLLVNVVSKVAKAANKEKLHILDAGIHPASNYYYLNAWYGNIRVRVRFSHRWDNMFKVYNIRIWRFGYTSEFTHSWKQAILGTPVHLRDQVLEVKELVTSIRKAFRDAYILHHI